MQVEMRRLSEIKPHPTNPRQIGTAAIQAVTRSLEAYGAQQPIVVDPEGIIIVGHVRWRAAKRLRWKEFPVVVADLPPEKAAAYRLADNRTHEEAEWDRDLLKGEFLNLKALEFDLTLTGFSPSELSNILDDETWPTLAAGDREPFQQVTFTLHDRQVARLKEAIKLSKGKGRFRGPNKNQNGNALDRIVGEYLKANGEG